MSIFPFGRSVIIRLAGIAAILGLVLAAYLVWKRSTSEIAEAPIRAPPPKISASLVAPSLYCEFYDISNTIVVVGFDFVVAFPANASPRFSERYEGTQEGTRTFDSDHRPSWSYALDDDGNRMITSPDGATRIMLYGLKPNTGGTLAVEAGLRSNDFRNLDGQCRQANFGGHSTAQ